MAKIDGSKTYTGFQLVRSNPRSVYMPLCTLNWSAYNIVRSPSESCDVWELHRDASNTTSATLCIRTIALANEDHRPKDFECYLVRFISETTAVQWTGKSLGTSQIP